ncbi:MAG: YdcH family protein [Endozoicomonas sp.]
MLRQKHNLSDDFDLVQDRISVLKQTDEQFHRLEKEYHALDHQVRGLEMRNVPVSDERFGAMKRRRVHLKDELLRRLTS